MANGAPKGKGKIPREYLIVGGVAAGLGVLLLLSRRSSNVAATTAAQTGTTTGGGYGTQGSANPLQPILVNQGPGSTANPTTPGAFSQIAGAQWAPNGQQFDIVGLTQSGQVEHAWWNPATGIWSGWENLSKSGKLTSGGPVTGPPQTPANAESGAGLIQVAA